MTGYDGIVLAGGSARRLGGVRKPDLVVGGRSLLTTALDALDAAVTVVAVGPRPDDGGSARWVREHPVGGGPVAAISAALPLGRSSVVVVLAADLPFVTRAAVEQLLDVRRDAVAVIAVDASGHDQPLLGCYDRTALREAIPSTPNGASMRQVLRELEASGTVRRVDLGGEPPVCWDCDTAADLSRARALV